MSARAELPEVDQHALDELLAECQATLRRLLAWGGAGLLLALVMGALYLRATAATGAA